LGVPRLLRNYIDGSQARIIWNIANLLNSIQILEFTILANDIGEVNDLRSLGQLLALGISVGALVALITDAMTKERSKLYGFPLRDREDSP